jgi:hypothetical protein
MPTRRCRRERGRCRFDDEGANRKTQTSSGCSAKHGARLSSSRRENQALSSTTSEVEETRRRPPRRANPSRPCLPPFPPHTRTYSNHVQRFPPSRAATSEGSPSDPSDASKMHPLSQQQQQHWFTAEGCHETSILLRRPFPA